MRKLSLRLHRRDWVQDQNGFKTTYGYDDADRLVSVTDAQSPTPGVTQYTYDTENNLTDIYDAANNHTHMDYAANGVWLSKITFPSGLTEQYLQYDSVWPNLRWKRDRNVNDTHYIYDNQNRLYLKTYPDGTSVEYDYDLAGRLMKVIDAAGTYTFTYDNMNRLTQTSTDYKFDSAGAFTVKYGYDAGSNRASMTDPQNLGTAYTYDVLNRLHTLAFNGQNPGFTFGYDALSRRTSLTRPNGVNTSYGYDAASRLLSVLHQLGQSTLDGASYTYDGAGNRNSRTDQRTGVALNYSYDNIYQLQQALQGGSTQESYSYDLVGNRQSSLGVSPYLYNTSNQLTSTPTASYTYDNNGNLKTKSDGTQYNWDFENRLTSVVLPGAGGTVSFKYDGFGRRAQKSFVQGANTTTTDYLYDGPNLLEEVDQNGNLLARYTQGQNVDEPLTELRSGTTSYYQQDGLGSITSLSNSVGALANTYTYDSFGKLIASTGTATNPFLYTGRESDSETGNYFYRARYYDSAIGRFLSEDPIRFGGGPNFYVYAGNNPTNLTDWNGLKTSVCCRPLRGLAGITTRRHCYIRISTNDGAESHTLGLHKDFPNGDPLPGGPGPVLDDPTDRGGDCKDVKDATPCKERRLVHHYNAPCIECGTGYSNGFPWVNSNTWVVDVLSHFGMTAPQFDYWIPGYN